MSRFAALLSVKSAKNRCMWIAVTMLTACASSIPPSKIGPSPLVTASCPPTLGPLRDDSFGATTEKLTEVAGVYFRCRCAALGGDGTECQGE